MQGFNKDKAKASFDAAVIFCDALKLDHLLTIIEGYISPERKKGEMIRAALTSLKKRLMEIEQRDGS